MENRRGNLNVVVGLSGLLVCAIGGFALGATFDRFAVKDGQHVLSVVRFYLREGHSHGMPISLLNVVVGLLIDRWGLTGRLRTVASTSAALALLLPVGLAVKGATGAAGPSPIGLLGAAAFVVAVSTLLVASLGKAPART